MTRLLQTERMISEKLMFFKGDLVSITASMDSCYDAVELPCSLSSFKSKMIAWMPGREKTPMDLLQQTSGAGIL